MAPGDKKCCVEYNYLGPNAAIKVSNICLGTMTFGKAPEMYEITTNTDEAKSHVILDKFYELGGNFIDTANIYSNGESEEIIGKWMKKYDRSSIVLATKVRFGVDLFSGGGGLGRGYILTNLDKSLKRLQTDYIDLYYSHCWDSGTKLEETLRTFNDCVRSGKVRYIGISNVTPGQMQKIIDYNKFMGFDQCVTLQGEYSLVEKGLELEATGICKEEGITLVPYSPLKGGLLTGKFKRDATAKSLAGTRLGWTAEKPQTRTMGPSPYVENYRKNEDYWKLMDVMQSIAKSHGKSVSQVALRWTLQKDIIPSVIIGARTVQQLEDNMGAGTGWKLTAEEMIKLDEASSFATPANIYPYGFVKRSNADRVNKI